MVVKLFHVIMCELWLL